MACSPSSWGSDSTGDLRNYHYYGGWALLNKQVGFDIAPAQLQTYHHPLLDALFLSVTGTSMSEAVPNIFLFGAIWLVLRGDEAGCAGAG